MRAFILSLAAVLALSPLEAATKKSATSTPKTAQAPSKKNTQVKASSSKKNNRKVTVARATQQHPTSERYTEIEEALVARGYLEQANGVWGPDSISALKKFQADQEIPADGKLGALSLTALGLGPRRGAFVVAPVVPVNPAAPVAAD